MCDYCYTVINKEEYMKVHVEKHISKGDKKIRNIDSPQGLSQGFYD